MVTKTVNITQTHYQMAALTTTSHYGGCWEYRGVFRNVTSSRDIGDITKVNQCENSQRHFQLEAVLGAYKSMVLEFFTKWCFFLKVQTYIMIYPINGSHLT